MRGNRWSDDPAVIAALKIKVPQNMADCFALIESEYFGGDWVMGAEMTVADPYLFAIEQWMESDCVDPARFARLAAHRNRVGSRPATKRALARYR
jgi:glutathione S-transferase